IDLVIICTINRDHGAITQAALEADKHVIVEYPLALCPYEAKNLIDLAKKKDKLLHVEHMELIGGLHQTIRSFLPQIGELAYARYATISSQAGRQKKWSYNYEMFGFPLSAALSRIHRLTNLFGSVQQVSCQSRFWQSEDAGYFSACLCNAQLYFSQGVTAEITYGKGDVFTHSYRNFEIHGKEGTLIFAGEEGYLWRGKKKISLPVTPRRGLFAQDTRMVLDYLWENKPLYVQPTDSLYALTVADVARISAATGKTITLDD
ncbi:MAG: gfo/Idh/MocA family oxidoreductase, partial [Cyanobacteria bacterium J083]